MSLQPSVIELFPEEIALVTCLSFCDRIISGDFSLSGIANLTSQLLPRA